MKLRLASKENGILATVVIFHCILTGCDVSLAAPAGEQLLNLAETPQGPRFKTTEQLWPKNAGEASVCLWNDDKLAAFSITIDDNTAPDVEWWLGKSKEMNLPLTWFLISERAGTGGYWGTWPTWKKVLDAGHAIESHTVTHLHIEEPGWKNIEWEYADSITQLEVGLPNHRIRFLAYPGGTNSKLNDRTVAAKYFLAARGTGGTLNSAGQIDYLNVNAMSAPSLDNPATPYNDVHNLLNPAHRGYRGWAVLLYHLVKDKEAAQRFFDFYKANANELWGATFGDVAIYGQERDSAILKTEENSANLISFSLSDRMDDARYNAPLTIKVRLPDVWKSAKAVQNEKPIEVKVIEHQGARYALVKSVPDRGLTILSPQ